MRRRRFIATSAGVSAVLVSGCAGIDEDGLGGETDDDQQSDGSASDPGELGTFRLLISDMPADIGDFDSLDVWFSSARVFRGDGEEEDVDEEEETDDGAEEEDAADGDEETGDDDGDEETDGEDTEDDGEDDPDEDDDAEDEEADDDERGGFVEFELDDANVNLTEVVGERAMPVLEDELDAGTYSGVHLFVEDVEGIVEGEEVGVKVPSEKLKIVKPFEIGTEETVSFVFDINVVKRGNNDAYNLLPVVAKSGVNGEDVEVDEVEEDEESDEDDDGGDEAEDSSENGDDEEEQDQSGDGDGENGDAENGEG